MTIKTRDKPIDFNSFAVSGDSVEMDTQRFISQNTSNDKVIITAS